MTYGVPGSMNVFGSSDLGIRVIAVCDAITLAADGYLTGTGCSDTPTNTATGVDFLRTTSDISASIDLIQTPTPAGPGPPTQTARAARSHRA